MTPYPPFHFHGTAGLNRETRFVFFLFLVCIFFLASPPHAFAQTSDEKHYEILDPLEISATRSSRKAVDIPAAVDVVEREEIQLFQSAVTFDEALTPIPGLFFQNQQNFAQDLRISMRGFGARSPFGVRGVKILLDEIPLTLPDGLTQVDILDPGIIDRIEVLRGPSSSLYGNASGGVISVFTEGEPDTKFDAELRTLAGHYGLHKSHLKFGGLFGNGYYRFFASHLKLDGYRDHSATENFSFLGKIVYPTESDSEWMVTLGKLHSPYAEDPGGLTLTETAIEPQQASPRNLLFSAGEEVDQEIMGARYKKSFDSRNHLTLAMHLGHRDFSNRLPFRDGGIVEFERWAPGLTWKFINNGKALNLNNHFIVGVDFQYQRDDRQRFNNIFGSKGAKILDRIETVRSVGPFLRNELSLNPNIELVGGVRFDNIRFGLEDHFLADGDQSGSITLSAWSGTAGAVWHLNSTHHLYANFATAFETPTSTELINHPTGGPGFNTDLKAQNSLNYEIGAKGVGGFGYQVSLFYILSKDEIVPFEIAAFPGRSFFRNAGESVRKGFEAALNYSPAKHLETRLSYTYSDFKFTEFVAEGRDLAGNDIPGIPTHRFFASLDYKHPQGWFSRFNLQHVGSFFVDDQNSLKSNSYTLADLFLGYEGKAGLYRWTAFIGFKNLLNETYNSNIRINAFGGRFFEPGPPFNIFAGVTLAFVLPD